MITKLIDNFGGRLTREVIGDMNSGFAKWSSTFGNDPFTYPNQLTWFEQATRIDPNATVITDLIMAGKERVESGISYVYCIGHTGRLYKIQVNDPSSYNPNYDNPVLLATLSINTPTFTRGGFLDFYGALEQIFISHDKGVTSIHFDGTTETFVGILGSWTQNVPKPLKQFLGLLYVGNGSNIAEVSTGGLVNSYTKLSPAFPANTQARDLDLSMDGNYLHAVVTRLPLPDLTSSVQDATLIANTDSYVFKWNGVDQGYTSSDLFPSFSLTAKTVFTDFDYTFGYDIAGATVFNPTTKILSPILSQSPLPNALGSNGNIVGWSTTEFYQGFSRLVNYIYGSLDKEVGVGWWRQWAMSAQGGETDILRVPFQMPVSNFGIGSVTNGYPGGVFGSGKTYISTFETSPQPTAKYKLYKWFPVSTGVGTAIGGIYETQQETSVKLFRNILKKKLRAYEIRVYTHALVSGNSFQIDLIGSDGNPIAGTTQVFTVGTNVTAGADMCLYNPQMAPQHSLGLRITNLGSVNWICDKIEVDVDEVGK